MKKISRDVFIKSIILLIPMSFLFHYIETSVATNGSILGFLGSFLFIVLAGLASRKFELNYTLKISFLSIILSMILGRMFIISPNESWFNPFGMNFAIIFTGIIILTGILIVRFFSSKVFK